MKKRTSKPANTAPAPALPGGGWAEFGKAMLAKKATVLLELNPAKLKPHPLLERITMRPELLTKLSGLRHYKDEAGDERLSWEAFCANIKERGVREPLRVAKIDGEWVILDGRHRWQAALDAGIAVVTCIEDRAEDAKEVILASVSHRKRMTSQATAYLWVMMHSHLAVEAKMGRPSKDVAKIDHLTREDVARLSGVSMTLVKEACATYKELSSRPARRDKMEPLILAGLLNLGDARTGARGGNGKPDPDTDEGTNYYLRTKKALTTLTHWAAGFPKLTAEDRAALKADLAHEVSLWPAEFTAFFQETLPAGGEPKKGARAK